MGTALRLVSGERLPLHATAAGKILLAHGHGPLAEVRRHTRHTVTAQGTLGSQLIRIRETGLATAHKEYVLGELSFAAPVPRYGRAMAAVFVTLPTSRSYNHVDSALRDAARTIHRGLAVNGAVQDDSDP
ncbi:IclR family transcriptional regulator domain-containing protein [Streptomyces sp. NPDC001595]|uniref:IclR family transcriptional regulator domain-containing protein n=1 Tax=Streptomyces sp. NPDC001532 TaxID=3154520 RepID=UPI0033205F2E